MAKLIKIAVIMAMVAFCSYQAFAAEAVIDAEVNGIVQATDKNGTPYIRIIVMENRRLQGVDYTIGVPVMGFGEMVGPMSGLKPGDRLKAIVRVNSYMGRDSYNVIKLLE